MKNIKEILSTYRMPIILISLIGILILTFINPSKESEVDNTPTIDTEDTPQVLEEISEGNTTLDQIIDTYGQPINTSDTSKTELLEFQSNSPTRNHSAISNENNTITYFKQIITVEDKVRASNILRRLGATSHILYGEHSEVQFHLYVYPQLGRALVANTINNDVLEIWYFEPTTFEEFKSSLGSEYSEEPPQGEEFIMQPL